MELKKLMMKSFPCLIALLVIGCQGAERPKVLRTTQLEKDSLSRLTDYLDAGGNVDRADRDGNTALHRAAWQGHRYITEALLERGANTVARNKNGRTPLHYAAMYNKLNIAELLVAEGVNVNVRDNEGQTPLYWAVKYERAEVAEYLRQNGGK